MITLNESNVDAFVAKQTRLETDVHWDGWDLVFFNEDSRARTNPNGCYKDGHWGYQTVVSINENGEWLVKPSLTRGMKRARA